MSRFICIFKTSKVGCFDKKPIEYNHISSKYDEYMHEFDSKRLNQELSLCNEIVFTKITITITTARAKLTVTIII